MEKTFTANEWRIIGIASVGHALCHVSELAFAAVIGAVMVEFTLAPDRAAALAVPGFVLYGVGAIPAGIWTDRRGSREVLAAYYLLLTFAATAVCLAQTVWQLSGALALLGAAISLYHPAGLTMISHGCQRRGRAMGINGVAGSLGIAVGPTLGLLLGGLGFWRATYGVIAVASGLTGLATFWIPIHLPIPAAAKSPSSGDTAPPRAWTTLPLLFLAMLAGGINYRCLTTALPTYLNDSAAATSALAGNEAAASDVGAGAAGATHSRGGLLFAVLALGGVGQLLGGHIADRYRPALAYLVVISLTIPCALVMAHGNSYTIPIAAGVLAVFMFSQQPLENTIIAEATPLQWRSRVYGLKFILAFGLASSGAYLTGWIWTTYGLARVFDTFAAIGLVMLSFASAYVWQARWRKDARYSNRGRSIRAS